MVGQRMGACCHVSILVLVDAALRPAEWLAVSKEYEVSILVLVDAALRLFTLQG